MAYQASTDTLLSIEGRLVTGKGTLFSIQERPFSHKHEEVSLVGEEYDYNVQTGKWSYGFGLSGFVKDDNTSLTRLINATEVAKEPLSGCPCGYLSSNDCVRGRRGFTEGGTYQGQQLPVQPC